jgi:Uma2 family endonuclease
LARRHARVRVTTDAQDIGACHAEILSDSTAEKDLDRNIQLYLRVPSIREYWIVDTRQDYDRPTLLVYRRRGERWQKPIHVAPGSVYTTKLLPDFRLPLDRRA